MDQCLKSISLRVTTLRSALEGGDERKRVTQISTLVPAETSLTQPTHTHTLDWPRGQKLRRPRSQPSDSLGTQERRTITHTLKDTGSSWGSR